MNLNTYTPDIARHFRQSDDKVADVGSRKHWAQLLENLTQSFKRPISVLDIGCGTGRFIYCLKNTDYYLGLDSAPHMLQQARAPLRQERITVKQMDFICADIFNIDLSDKKFDLIYSIGVLGEAAPFNTNLYKKLLGLLSSKRKTIRDHC